ncbi:phage tail tube protein [Vreelandella titanicae]
MKTNRRAMRFALESDYNDGTTTPEAATDAILMREITVTPLSGSNIARNFVRPYYGNSPQAPGEKHVEAVVEVELNTSGALGTPPPWGKLLRACGWSEVIEVGERVIYSPVSENEDSGVFFCNVDGNLHKGRGARGTPAFTVNAENMPVIRFTYRALISPVTAEQLPNVTLSQWRAALAVNSLNTEPLQFMGATVPFNQFSLDMAGQVIHNKIVGSNNIEITGRSPSGQLSIEDPGVSVVDYFAMSQNAQTGPLTLIHGKTPAERIEIIQKKVGIESPTYSDQDGIQMLSINYMPEPTEGNDEVLIVVGTPIPEVAP